MPRIQRERRIWEDMSICLSECLAPHSRIWQVCEKEGVHLEVVPLTKEYWEKVVSGSIDSIRHGLTPNPDVLCNSRLHTTPHFIPLGFLHACLLF